MDIMKGLYAAVLTSMLVLSGCLHEQPGIAETSTYEADDAAGSATSGTTDTLLRLRLSGRDSLSWTSTNIQLSVGDTVYRCSLSGADPCQISAQDGGDGNAWEPGESIFLRESGTDICTEPACTVVISVVYDGDQLTGASPIIVN